MILGHLIDFFQSGNFVDSAWLIGPILPQFPYFHKMAIWGLVIRENTELQKKNEN